MKPIVLSISYRSDVKETKIASFAYAGIETNKWIYAKLVKEFPGWPDYIKVRKKNTYAEHKMACEYIDEKGKKRHSFVQVLATGGSAEDFQNSNLVINLQPDDEDIIIKVNEVINTCFFKNIMLVNLSDANIRFEME